MQVGLTTRFAKINADIADLQAEVDAVKAKTANLPDDPAATSQLPPAPDNAGIAAAQAAAESADAKLDQPVDANVVQVATEPVQGVADFHADVGDLELGEIAATLDALQNRLATLAGAGVVHIHSPHHPTRDDLTLTRGDSYTLAVGRPIDFTSEQWPDLTGATVVLSARSQATGELLIDHRAGEVVKAQADGDGPAMVRFEFPTNITNGLPAGRQALRFDVQATIDGEVVTIARGHISVAVDVSEEGEQ